MNMIFLEGTILNVDHIAKIDFNGMEINFYNQGMSLIHTHDCKSKDELMSIRSEFSRQSDVACQLGKIRLDVQDYIQDIEQYIIHKRKNM